MTLILGVICLALLCLLALRERAHDKLTLEREQAWRIERTGLLTRIQAPEVAPFLELDDEPQYVPFEDDDAFQEAVE